MFYINNSNRVKSFIFVAVQFSALFYILLTGRIMPDSPWLQIPVLAGFGLGIWAIVVMGTDNVNIPPDVMMDAHLVEDGPYKVIRHPMYTAIFLVVIPLVADSFTIGRMIALAILLIDLIFKIHYEESQLISRFSGYEAYRKRTNRVIPYIW